MQGKKKKKTTTKQASQGRRNNRQVKPTPRKPVAQSRFKQELTAWNLTALPADRYHWLILALAAVSLFFTLVFFCEAVFSQHLAYRLPFVSYGGTFRWHSVRLGTAEISLYWTAHLVGLVGMCILCSLRRRAYGLGPGQAILTGLLLGVFGYIGAKLLFIMENLPTSLENGIGAGGVSFFGTVFFMPLVIPLMGYAMKKDPLLYLDYCTPAGVLMLACIRCGCFMRGCCGGITVWIGANPVIFPVQLMECTLDLVLLFALLRLERTRRFEKRCYFLFMSAYGFLRFFLEFLRNTPKVHFGFSNGQCFSLICLLIGALLLSGCTAPDWDAKAAEHLSTYSCEFERLDTQEDAEGHILYRYQTRDEREIVFTVTCYMSTVHTPFGVNLPFPSPVVRDDLAEQICAYVGRTKGTLDITENTIDETSAAILEILSETEDLLNSYGIEDAAVSVAFTLTNGNRTYTFPYGNHNETFLQDQLRELLAE